MWWPRSSPSGPGSSVWPRRRIPAHRIRPKPLITPEQFDRALEQLIEELEDSVGLQLVFEAAAYLAARDRGDGEGGRRL
jgi:hypothetical protein